jgi:hypothetical protein
MYFLRFAMIACGTGAGEGDVQAAQNRGQAEEQQGNKAGSARFVQLPGVAVAADGRAAALLQRPCHVAAQAPGHTPTGRHIS